MSHTIAAFLPITVLMIGALKTKRLAEMMFLSSFLGAVLIHKERFFRGYIDFLNTVRQISDYQIDENRNRNSHDNQTTAVCAEL